MRLAAGFTIGLTLAAVGLALVAGAMGGLGASRIACDMPGDGCQDTGTLLSLYGGGLGLALVAVGVPLAHASLNRSMPSRGA